MNFFKSQDEARRNTGRLVALFSLAVISLIIMTNLLVMFVFGYFRIEQAGSINTDQMLQHFDWQLFLVVSAAVAGVIALGSLYKILALAGGGARVAEMLGAELVVYGSNDFNKQRLLNVVEEMAIASGTPVPPVYLLDEDGINAFAAGYKPGDAVIGVTRGAIEKLSREQLQGVIAHEFSHILNGDMKLNIRLIGLLHGILLIGTYELQQRPEIPYRVVINEAVELAKIFGGTEGFKYVNGVLDKVAAHLRPDEARPR